MRAASQHLASWLCLDRRHKSARVFAAAAVLITVGAVWPANISANVRTPGVQEIWSERDQETSVLHCLTNQPIVAHGENDYGQARGIGRSGTQALSNGECLAPNPKAPGNLRLRWIYQKKIGGNWTMCTTSPGTWLYNSSGGRDEWEIDNRQNYAHREPCGRGIYRTKVTAEIKFNGEWFGGTLQTGEHHINYRSADDSDPDPAEGDGFPTQPGDQAVVGDWDGDGDETIGIFRGGADGWFLKNDNSGGFHDIQIPHWGYASDRAVVGDWDGDGDDTIGVYRGGAEGWYLRNDNSWGPHDIQIPHYGFPVDQAVVGDWDGDGDDTIGIYRGEADGWFLRNDNSWGAHDIQIPHWGYWWDKAVVGDWDGDGDTTIGVFRGDAGGWFIRNHNSWGPHDIQIPYWGYWTDTPVAGDWDADFDETIGVFRGGVEGWYLRNDNSWGPHDIQIPHYGY